MNVQSNTSDGIDIHRTVVVQLSRCRSDDIDSQLLLFSDTVEAIILTVKNNYMFLNFHIRPPFHFIIIAATIPHHLCNISCRKHDDNGKVGRKSTRRKSM